MRAPASELFIAFMALAVLVMVLAASSMCARFLGSLASVYERAHLYVVSVSRSQVLSFGVVVLRSRLVGPRYGHDHRPKP